MDDEFRKPFTAPPIIFLTSLGLGIVLGLLIPWPVFPLWFQLFFGPVFILGGAWLIWGSMRAIKSAGTTYDPFALSTALTTSGVYRLSRNPGYLGLGIVQLGLAILLDNIWVVAGLVIAGVITTVFVIKLEEEKLLKSFGEPYLNYCKLVRRWL